MLQDHIRPQLKGKSDTEIYKICSSMQDYYFEEDRISLWRNSNVLTEEQINWYLDNKVK